MIVKDKVKSIELANKISAKYLVDIFKDIQQEIPEDEPAEYIYLGVHTLANMLTRTIHILSGYAETYAIPNSNKENLRNLINFIMKEYESFDG